MLAAEAVSRLPTVTAETATFVRFDGAMCVVMDNLGVEQAWAWSGQWPPQPGDAVRVEQRAGRHIVTGTVLPKPTRGTVKAVSSTTLVVTADGTDYEVLFNRSSYTSPAVGHIVQLVWGVEGGIATGILSVVPPPPPPPLPVEAAPTTGRQTFRAVVAGQWRDGDWTAGTPEVSITRTAGWHYGPSLAATLPDAAQITLARIYLPAVIERFAPPLVQAFDGPPPSSAGVGPQIQLGAQNGWIDLPVGVAEQLRAGNRGIRLLEMTGATGTWTTWKSLSQDPMSGALDLAWKA